MLLTPGYTTDQFKEKYGIHVLILSATALLKNILDTYSFPKVVKENKTGSVMLYLTILK